MQATSCFVQPFFPTKSATKDSPLTFTRSSLGVSRGVAIKAASVSFEPLAFNYNSPFSVFPVEACETIGGDACAANMFPEAKLDKQGGSVTNTKSFFEEVDREYFDYTSETKRVKLHTSDPLPALAVTSFSEALGVLRAEACDDLGGEFCESPYNYMFSM